MNLNLDIFAVLSENFLHLVVKKKTEYMEENLVVETSYQTTLSMFTGQTTERGQ